MTSATRTYLGLACRLLFFPPMPNQTPRMQPSSNAENLRDQFRDNKVASDGRKLEDADHVGARQPDSDADVEAEEANPDPEPVPPAKGENEPRH